MYTNEQISRLLDAFFVIFAFHTMYNWIIKFPQMPRLTLVSIKCFIFNLRGYQYHLLVICIMCIMHYYLILLNIIIS